MKSQNKIRALCFFDHEIGRDVEILLPVMFYAEKYLNIDIEKAFIFDIDKIRREKPDLVIIANAIGSTNHHLIAKYAYENGIKVFALISEGNFKTDGTFRYWGYNTDKKFYQEYICLWSERTKKFLEKVLPEYKDKMVVTGGVGFDRYKIYKFESKTSFLRKYNYTKFKKVIGYAGWAFGKLHNPSGLKEIRNAYKEKADEKIKWMLEQQKLVENVLKQAVENNPDILFILKRHPNEIHPHLVQKDNNEMVNLSHYPNVLYLTNEEDVHTLISVSDIWTAFESTTVIEAWLMKNNMPTIFINPDPDFKRDNNYKGTIIVKNYHEFQQIISEYYSTGKVAEMLTESKIAAKEQIIKDTIGYADGFNHIRAGYYLTQTIKNIDKSSAKKVKFNLLYFLRYIFMVVAGVFYYEPIYRKLPKLKKHIWVFKRYKLKNIDKLKKKYYKYLEDFHKKNNIEKEINNEDFWKKIL